MHRRELDYGPYAGSRGMAVPLSEQLIRQALVTEDGLFQLMASISGVGLISADDLFERARWDANVAVLQRVPRVIAQTLVMYPIEYLGGMLHVAAMDPTDWRGLAHLQLCCNAVDIRVSLARRSAVLDAIDSAYTAAEIAGELVTDNSPTVVQTSPFIDPGDPRGKTMVTAAFPTVTVKDVMRPLSRPLSVHPGLRTSHLCVLASDPAAEVLVRLNACDEVDALVVDHHDRPIGELELDDILCALAVDEPSPMDA